MESINFNIFIIRHAQTNYGERNQFMGILDVPCSDNGVKEANIASNEYQNIEFFRIYSSPLIRALQTANILFPNKNILIEQSLIERGLGEWAGKDLSTIKKEFPEAFYNSGYIDPYYTPKNGETIESVIHRVKFFVDKLTELYKAIMTDTNRNNQYNIAIVTHNGIIRVLRYLVSNLPTSEIFIDSEKYLKSVILNYNGKSWKFVQN